MCGETSQGGFQHPSYSSDQSSGLQGRRTRERTEADDGGGDCNIRCGLHSAAELPVEMNSFKSQQARWAKGLIQTAIKLLPRILRSRLPWKIKIEAFFHLTANISYPLMIVLSFLLLPAMIVRFSQGWFQMLYIDLPLWLASTASVSTFYLISQKELYPDWRLRVKYLPFLMSLGIGLSVSNSKAVMEALLGIETSFKR